MSHRRGLRCASALLYLMLCLLGAAVTPVASAADDSAAETLIKTLLSRHASQAGVTLHIELAKSSRLKLKQCQQPKVALAGHRPGRWGSQTLRVTCASVKRTLFIRAQVSAQGRYWVAAEDIAAKTPLKPGLLKSRRGELSQLPGNAITDLQQIKGKVAARPLRAGAVLQSHWLKSPVLVTRRQRVRLVVEGPGFQIQREGQALDEGGLGDSIRVRLGQREQLSGIITGPASVKLTGH